MSTPIVPRYLGQQKQKERKRVQLESRVALSDAFRFELAFFRAQGALPRTTSERRA